MSVPQQYTEGRNTEFRASEHPIQLRDDLAYSLGIASEYRDDVLGSPIAIILELPRSVIYSLLCGNDGMDCDDESFTKPRLSWMSWDAGGG